MKLDGVVILNLEGLKQHFDLSQLWVCMDNGTLQSFEHSLPAGQFLVQAVRETLAEMYGGRTPDFVRAGCLNLQRLRARLEGTDSSFRAYTRQVQTGQDFFDRSWDQVVELAAPLCAGCTDGQAWRFYLSILLQVQARPKLPLRPQDLEFLARQLHTQPAASGQGADSPPSVRLVLCEDTLFCATEQGIFCLQGDETAWRQVREGPVAGYAYTRPLGLLAISAQGELDHPAPPALLRQAEGKTLTAVTAFGEQYVLLTEQGQLLSNLRLPDSLDWPGLRRIHLGLNSLTGIAGPLRGVVQYGADPKLTNFTGVRTVDTRTDGARHFAVLREGGELHLDSRPDAPVPGVQAACLGPDGAYFAADGGLFWCGWDGAQQVLRALPPAFCALEVRATDQGYACLGRQDGQEVLYVSGREQPLSSPPGGRTTT